MRRPQHSLFDPHPPPPTSPTHPHRPPCALQSQSLGAYEQLVERARGLGLRTLDLSNAVFGAMRAA